MKAVRPATRPLHAFTLVELLVVIGIIAVLIGILLPTLSRAQKQARGVQCMSNIRQLGIAFKNYAESNRGWYDCHTYTPGGIGAGANSWYFSSLVTPSGTVFDVTGGRLYKYMGNAVRNCPEADQMRSYIGNVADQFPIAYGFSAYMTVSTSWKNPNKTLSTVNASRLRSPVDTFFFADAATFWNGHDLRTSMSIDNPTYRLLGLESVPAFHGRHLGKGNVLWFDGHVSAETPNYTNTEVLKGTTQAVRKRANLGDLMPPNVVYSTAPGSLTNYYFWKDKVKQQ